MGYACPRVYGCNQQQHTCCCVQYLYVQALLQRMMLPIMVEFLCSPRTVQFLAIVAAAAARHNSILSLRKETTQSDLCKDRIGTDSLCALVSLDQHS